MLIQMLTQMPPFLQNVKLLQQFINPHTGVVYDPTRTGKKWASD